MGRYATYLPTQGAPWLQQTNGQALSGALGSELDTQLDRLRQGLLARFPVKGNVQAGVYGLPSDDALDQIGADRQLPRGSGESSAAYAARLLAAWDAWEFAGTHYGVLRALQVAGYANMVIVQDNGRWAKLVGSAGDITDLTFGTLMACVTRPSSHAGWTFDGRIDFYSRFGIVFTADAANLSSTAGQLTLNAIVNLWRPAKAQYVASYVILAGRLLGWPTGRTLGTDPNLGTNSVRVIAGDGSGATVIGP